ncbi:MAG: HD domain-containing protein [Desulfatirhabdiaceae bacterium]|nr:HD domain-containing protein [Desulfatirhabdiaceae bacterium]
MAKSDSVPRLVQKALNKREMDYLSPIGAFSQHGFRRVPDPHEDTDFRQSFSIDADRILHSLAYTRYIDKTQVFYLVQNDHITHRVLHVQLVSKIARTIGRFLGLNEDLIEAIALGHDIGHSPFGHDGETFLSEICRVNGVGYFLHNLQSVQFLDRVERKGKGWNLCLQTLDGILCHDGEIHNQRLEPFRAKVFETLESEIATKQNDPAARLVPMTLEGCVVRMADTVSYIGRDIEDAIRLNMIRRSDLPAKSVRVLGSTNGTIVYRLVTDIIQNSFLNTYAAFSPEVSEALESLKAFNLERIYLTPDIKSHTAVIRDLFHLLFERFLTDIEKENRSSVIFSGFLKDMSDDYLHGHRPAEIVRDFIAGMTDRYFLSQCPEALRPSPRPF